MIQRAADVGVPAELITAARAVNRTMPLHVANVLNDMLYQAGIESGKGRVLLLGWSYKAEVGDPRETPAEPLAETLVGKNIEVSVWDPHLEGAAFPSHVHVVESPYSSEAKYDLVVLVTAHKDCINLDWKGLLNSMRTPLIYDGRRVLDLDALSELGWETHAVGRPR